MADLYEMDLEFTADTREEAQGAYLALSDLIAQSPVDAQMAGGGFSLKRVVERPEIRVWGVYVVCDRYELAPIYVGRDKSARAYRRAVGQMSRRVNELRPWLRERDSWVAEEKKATVDVAADKAGAADD